MKLLLESWREYLNEAAAGAESLPATTTISIKTWEISGTEFAEFEYVNTGVEEEIIGSIKIHRVKRFSKRCGDAWTVSLAQADDGWGPLLYDIAMEYASEHGGGLMPSRTAGTLSASARKVWNYYLNKRSDIESHQLDDRNNTLTPDNEDNCMQDTAKSWAIGPKGFNMSIPGRSWKKANNPLSKRYTKSPTTIQKLQSLGKLEISK